MRSVVVMLLPRQDALTMWYVTVEPCRVSVLRVKVRQLGGTM
jgi:hypothetical protein